MDYVAMDWSFAGLPYSHYPTGMAYMRASSLFVLTLLQLCRAEISDSLPESWYSANVINEGFQPKPISEIFSTESPFSSTNPIIVLPKSSTTPDEIVLLSTLPPLRKISSTGSSSGDFTKTTFLGTSSTTPLPPSIQTVPPSVQTIPPSTLQTIPPSTYQTSTFTPIVSQFTDQTQTASPPLFSSTLPTTASQFPPLSRSAQTQSQQIRLELVPQGQLLPGQNLPDQLATTQQQQTQTSTAGPLSNYFLIYQQVPQSIQGYPGLGTSQEVPQFTTVGSSTPTPSTVIIQPSPTVSPLSTRTAPPTSTTTPLPSSVRVTTPTARTTRSNNCQNNTNQLNSAPIGSFPLRIRVLAPSGSITNVNINPTVKSTTTRRPTTTKTRRTSKPKKNNYDSCTDGCKGRREPICAAPLSSTFLDPNTLKGFPSVCHMACHNSYRKDPYEKVLDGRCGRLRTRIRTVDSNTKLKRDELNKAQYFLDNGGTKTIVEFSALN